MPTETPVQPTTLDAPETLTTESGTYLRLNTTLTDYGAFLVLEELKGRNSFAATLHSDFSRWGKWTPNKRVWAHKLAIDALERQKAPLPASLVANAGELNFSSADVLTPKPVEQPKTRRERSLEGLQNLLGLSATPEPSEAPAAPPAPRLEAFGKGIFARVARLQNQGKKRIKFTLTLPSGEPLVIKLGGEGASYQNQGCLFVSNGGRYGVDQTYYGKFDREGYFFAARACTPEVIETLAKFAAEGAQ